MNEIAERLHCIVYTSGILKAQLAKALNNFI